MLGRSVHGVLRGRESNAFAILVAVELKPHSTQPCQPSIADRRWNNALVDKNVETMGLDPI